MNLEDFKWNELENISWPHSYTEPKNGGLVGVNNVLLDVWVVKRIKRCKNVGQK